MKNLLPLLLFLLMIVTCSPSIFLYERHFPYERGHSILHSIIKTCANFSKRMKPAYILALKHTVNFAREVSPMASDDWV